MIVTIVTIIVSLASGCGFVEGAATPYDYFPRSEGEHCPGHIATSLASYNEAMEAVARGASVRRRAWLTPKPGKVCYRQDIFLSSGGFYDGEKFHTYVPSADDKVANDWERDGT
jgi:hypothetical protein